MEWTVITGTVENEERNYGGLMASVFDRCMMQDTGIRINKYLSEAGICSRREADRQIDAGNVTIDGKVAVMGDKVMTGQQVCYNGKVVSKEEEMILLAVNKPAGVVCTAEKREKNNIVDFINYPKRIYPVGRLDKDSEGLILMTNNGEIVNKMMRAGNMHEKEYIVQVNREVTESFIHGMANGVLLKELNITTRKCQVRKLGKHKFQIILTQGLNRQIRRMCEYFGYRVVSLERVRIMNIHLGELERGKYRQVTEEELQELYRLIRNSSNETVIPAEERTGKRYEKNGGRNESRGKSKTVKRNTGIS